MVVRDGLTHPEFPHSGSSLNPAVEVDVVSGGNRVEQGLELGGWVRVRPRSPPSVEGDGEGARNGWPVRPWASTAVGAGGVRLGPLSCPSSGHGSGAVASSGPGGVNHWSQQKGKAQLIRVWWRRMACSQRTWKSARPSSSLICL